MRSPIKCFAGGVRNGDATAAQELRGCATARARLARQVVRVRWRCASEKEKVVQVRRHDGK